MYHIEDISPSATAEQSAAIVAAVERFIAESAPASATSDSMLNGWQRQGMHESCGLDWEVGPWGEDCPWR